MNDQPLFRQVRLSLANDQDVKFAIDILAGKVTVSQIAESIGQDHWSFDGDGDVVILSYSRDVDHTNADPAAAEKILGDRGNLLIRKYIIPAIFDSNAPIELVLQCCNLSTLCVIEVASALTGNTSFVGFTVKGNPGNDEAGNGALKRACVTSMAPIKWFQGRSLDASMREARAELARRRIEKTMENDDLSPRTKVAQLRQIQRSSPDAKSAKEDSEDTGASIQIRKTSLERPEDGNERERWHAEMRTKLRSSHDYTEEDVNRIIVNLELLQLQQTIDKLVFSKNS